ncbi:prevent-host-death protein [Burkholderia cepacia]|uniref:Prevent-host-death protein n=1 Tax=Burkholderia cepacia TaxID=292 RepID=A0AAX2RQL2_BURCE|nr:YlcI/YnfO family protein [Burkholderia cepacia]AIO25471.1 hypothetical protein DM41_382 [Burkholderia cepacia ATCC 25416]ASE95143.1 prevent-host-death protein [Burkholderia cepacia]ATF76678.1 prevent-host-death protein [Burkholderia cepacia]MCA8467577.1 prevent-host-death protein [Burkholderia cepacia]MDN7763490.1 YlcI/YnfO family protein [Burkholderia cepacia]
MKTDAFPSVRVEPELLATAKRVLCDGETLSNFIKQSIRKATERRRLQSAFIARGTASRNEEMHTDQSFSSHD